MGDERDMPASEADAELEREIRRGRKLTPEEALGRMAGPGAMKGESPMTRLRQADAEIESWLRSHLPDAGGGLWVVLHRCVKESDLLLQNYDRPLVALAGHCRQILESDYLLEELVGDADTEWGRVMGERPHFDRAGTPSDPDDPYTSASVRKALSGLLKQLAVVEG
jgi:hypothetical protein